MQLENIHCLVILRNTVIPRNVDVTPLKLVGYNTERATMRCYTTECRIFIDFFLTELQILIFITLNVDYRYIRMMRHLGYIVRLSLESL